MWTIEELRNAVEAVLASGGPIQESGRVRDVPDQRTIRYYTTLGLIDRPASMRGRTALYARRHLEQLVAIKRLQAEGLSLAEIQARLSAIAAKELRALARIPEAFDVPVSAPKTEIASARRAFWSDVPEATLDATPAAVESLARTLASVPLDTNTILTIAATRSLNDDDLRAIARASEPLIKTLRARNLIAAEEGEPS